MKKTVDVVEGKDLPPLKIDDIGPAQPVEAVERLDMDAVALEAFMNEPVEVFIQETNDENVGQFEYVGVEGRRQYVQRGRWQVIRRKYVERLVRARKTTYSQNLEPKDETMNTVRPHSAPQIPFSVRNDTPKGQAWLEGLMSEPA